MNPIKNFKVSREGVWNETDDIPRLRRPVWEVRLHEISSNPEQSLLLLSCGIDRSGTQFEGFRFENHHLVRFAKYILAQYDPTPEQEILDLLKDYMSQPV